MKKVSHMMACLVDTKKTGLAVADENILWVMPAA